GNLLSATNPISRIAARLGTIDKDLHTGVHLLVVRGCPGKGPLINYSVAECGSDWNETNGNLSIKEITLTGSTAPKPGTLSAQVINLSQAPASTRPGRD